MTRSSSATSQVLTAGTRIDQEKARDGQPIPTTRRHAAGDARGRRADRAGGQRGLDHADAAQSAGSRADRDDRRPDGGAARRRRLPPPVVKAAGARRVAVRAAGRRSPPPARRSTPSRRSAAAKRGRRGHSLMRSDFVTRSSPTALLLALPLDRSRAQALGQPPAPAAPRSRRRFQKVQLTAGRSTVLATDFDVTRIAVTNPAVADAVVVQPREILVDGKKARHGQPDRLGRARRARSTTSSSSSRSRRSSSSCTRSFPARTSRSATSEGATILSGRVSSTNVMLRMGEIAAASIPKAQVINLLQVPGRQREPAGDAAGAVRRGEPAGADRGGPRLVRRRASDVLGALDDAAVRGARRSTTTSGADELVFSDFLNLFFFDREAWASAAC